VPVNYLWTIVLFAIVMAAAYRMVGRPFSRRDGVALAIGFLAAWPLLDGGFALEREIARRERGRIDPGIVLTKLSSTGEDGSRTIGRRYRRFRPSPFVNTANGFRVYDVLTRMLLTGSRQAWVVDFRYPCGSVAGCVGRDFVPRALWTRLQPGQPVNIRSVEGRPGSGRLSENNDLLVPAVKFAMGGILALIAVLVGRGVSPREKYVTVPAVVISVTSVPSGDTLHWKVRFAYFDENGVARESADEVFKAGLNAGDDCVARYPAGKPDLGTLDASTEAAGA
jgi:hypothetical protein